MAPSIVKAFTTRLSRRRRKELKHKIFMSSSNLLHDARLLYAVSSYDTASDVVELKMEAIVVAVADEYLRRCRTVSKTPLERQYVIGVTNKHILPALNFSFDKHIERLNRMDTLNVLNDSDSMPRFLISGKLERFKAQVDRLNKKIKIQIRI